jgi:hypothetical protein
MAMEMLGPLIFSRRLRLPATSAEDGQDRRRSLMEVAQADLRDRLIHLTQW